MIWNDPPAVSENDEALLISPVVMNPMAFARGLSLPLRTDLIASRSTTGRNNRHHDRCPLEAGLTFLHGKAIRCQNPYVTVQVQTVAPRFQGVSKHTQCSKIVLKQELAI
jgi:hypothetical protein